MCNFFGSGCTGPTDLYLKRYSDQAQREYDAMRAMTSTPAYLQSMAGQANCFKEAPKRIKKGYLTQADIDNGTGPAQTTNRRTLRQWLSGVPGGWLTLAVLISFCLGMWALWGLWKMKVVLTAIKN